MYSIYNAGAILWLKFGISLFILTHHRLKKQKNKNKTVLNRWIIADSPIYHKVIKYIFPPISHQFLSSICSHFLINLMKNL